MRQLATRPVILIVDRSHNPEALLLDALDAVFSAGLGPALRLIERQGSARAEEVGARLRWVHRIWALAEAAGAEVLVSTRTDLARAANVNGVHLPEHAVAATEVRASWPEMMIGRSCHDRAGLVAAAQAADFGLLAPLRHSGWKTPSGPLLGVAGFAAHIQGISLPIYALGGVRLEDVRPLQVAGAAGVALLGTAFDAASPAAVAKRVAAYVATWLGGS